MEERRYKTITYAVKRRFTEECQQALINAFRETEVMDLYDGDLETYINVIAQISRFRKERVERLISDRDAIRNIVNKVLI